MSDTTSLVEALEAGWYARSRSALAHVVPFVAWLAMMAALGEAAGWKYALRTGLAILLLAWAKPWKYYPPPRLRNLPLALLAGLAVCAVWVLPELPFMERWPMVKDLYLRFGVMPLGKIPEYPSPSPYEPWLCGWPLTVVRLIGSAFVIAVIEEFFWRGFLYRWLVQKDFGKLSLRAFELQAFAIMCVLFGLEHDRWLVGIIAGAAYGGLVLLTGDLWCAIFAHVITNYVLGLYVVGSGNYSFW